MTKITGDSGSSTIRLTPAAGPPCAKAGDVGASRASLACCPQRGSGRTQPKTSSQRRYPCIRPSVLLTLRARLVATELIGRQFAAAHGAIQSCLPALAEGTLTGVTTAGMLAEFHTAGMAHALPRVRADGRGNRSHSEEFLALAAGCRRNSEHRAPTAL